MLISNLITFTRSLVDADASSFPAVNTTDLGLIYINQALEEVAGELISIDYSDWQFGDSNYTSLPTGLFTLVNSQETYQLTGNGTTGIDTTTPLLTFMGCSVKDNNGIWHPLQPISFFYDIHGQGIDPVEYFKTDGIPVYYEKREDFLVLYPAPDNGVTVTLTSGLKVFFQRGASTFSASDVSTGTKQPGIASPWHPLIGYKAALPYAIANKPARVPALYNEIAKFEKKMHKFYSQRGKDNKNIMTMKKIRYI